MEATESKRMTRAEEVRQERRRKPGQAINYGQKLGLDERQLDRNTYKYRFANDVGNRIAALEAQDWDRVPLDGKTVESRHVGVGANGQSTQAVLLRKRKDWYEADQKEKRKPLDEMDAAIRRGEAHRRSGEAELSDGVTYTPGSGNTITR